MLKSSSSEFENIDILGSIYDAALEGRFFEILLDVVSRHLRASTVLLIGEDTLQASGNFFLHRGLKSDPVRSHVTNQTFQDPWFQQQRRQMVGRVYQDHELLNRESLLQTPFYKELLSRQNSLECATGMVIHRSGTTQLVLEIRFAEQDAKTIRPRTTSMLEDIAQHIIRATRVFQLRHQNPLENEFASSLLELLPFPVFILDSDRRVYNMNAKASSMARRLEAIFVSADGYLNTVELQDHADFLSAIKNVSAVRHRNSEMFSLHKSNGGGFYFLTLTTLGAGFNQDLNGNGYVPFEGLENKMVLIVQDSANPLRLTHDSLWRSFGLTSAEAELAMSLLEGGTIGDYAAQRKVSKQTLRNQLLSIMRKTGTSRQSQLVSLLTRMAISTNI